jgi:hypothetical protein
MAKKAQPTKAPEPTQESAAKSQGPVKFEWPNAPNGVMVLNKNLGFEGRRDIQFFGGFYITSDEAEIAALRERSRIFHDVFEVDMTVSDRMHASTTRTPPPLPPE